MTSTKPEATKYTIRLAFLALLLGLWVGILAIANSALERVDADQQESFLAEPRGIVQ